ncbi:Crinkler (CRN), partial [Phytophthora megakarya]
SATRLFYRGKYYQWEDTNGTRYEYLHDALKINTVPCWFVLDGLNYDDLKDRMWFSRFTLLATSGQFSPKNESMQFMKMCLLPYWKQNDIQDFGLKYMKMEQSDVDARYFVSGGSLREFLDDDAKSIVNAALKCIATPVDAEKLNSVIGLGSNKQIDRIRMQGVPDRNNSIMRQEMGSMDWKELKVDCAGETTNECVAVMESWAKTPSKMEYWIPATSLCETIDAVAKWTAPDNRLRFCFLQLTKATNHKCNAAILWELAQPFVNEGLSVCYIALVPDEDKRLAFRLKPAQITKKEIVDDVPLYVAHFNEIQQ